MMRRLFVIISFLLIINSSAIAQEVTRPEKEKGPTEVAMEVFVLDIDEIDTAGQNFTANVFYRATWYDPRLKNLDTEKIRKPLNEIWYPPFQFINQQRLFPTFPEIADVYPSGKVVYKQRIWGSFSQPLELQNFPFDKQTFNINFATSGYDKDEIRFISPEESVSGIAPRFSVADWKITGWEASSKTSDVIPDIGYYVMTITATRRVGYFILQVIIPLCLIVIMSWSVFWIDPKQTGTQIGVATTAILTLIAYRFMVGNELPRFSYLTRLDCFTLASTILVFASLIEVIITSRLAMNDKLSQARAIDNWARWIFPAIFILSVLGTLVFSVFLGKAL